MGSMRANMIERTRFAKSGLETSRLGFGTSRLHYISRADRQRLLALAVDLGLTHIDTAPVYGDGLAEREVGQFIKGRRGDVVIATKFGFAADPLLDAFPALDPVLRPLRAGARRVGLWQMRRVAFSPDELGRSVEKSLRRLKTDAIDILLLHDPMANRVPSADRLLGQVAELRRRGLIRLFGLAGSWPSIAGLDPALRFAADVIQTTENDWRFDQPPDITYGALGSGPQSAFGAKADAGSIASRLRAALKRRAGGTVLVSTTNADHLRDLARVADGG
jgi:aryl-alcohol dehydrogenase-like predicted oxidoreductase